MKKTNERRLICLCAMVFSAIFIYSTALADFYVVASGKRAKRTILVSPKSTAAASGTALLNALNGITDAGVTNPYLIIIEPGIYDLGDSDSLQMKEYVDIQGSGEKVTKITGTIGSDTSGVLEGADKAEVRFLTVENTGGGTYARAIYNSSVSPAITYVTATASGGSNNNMAIRNDSSAPTMTNVTATVLGSVGKVCWGVYNYYSSPMMTNVTATASGGSTNNGVENYSSSPTMMNVTSTASGGVYSTAVINTGNSSPTMMNVTATASGGSNGNYGVYNITPSNATIDHSVLSGVTAIRNESSGVTTYVGNTRLDGGVSGGGNTICAGVYDGNLTFYADTCP